ncbi:PAS domain S-box protein [Hydrocarboniphaga sp.]|uniref:PAS domain S-box protein n=1 Tax=Hydrocarboniphaga sp. TaxID=2033016 RepID=UPI003D0B471F
MDCSPLQHWVVPAAPSALLLLVVIVWVLQVSGLQQRVRRSELAAREQADALRDSETLLRSIFEYAPQAILVVDLRGNILRANDQAALIFGEPLQLLIGSNVEHLIPDRLRARYRENLLEYFGSSNRGLARPQWPVHGLRDGESFPMEVSMSHILVGGQQLVVAMATDISQRHLIEQSLRESDYRFRTIMENAPIGMAIVALDGRWIEINQAVSDITGYSQGELLGMNLQDITHPDDLAHDLDLMDQLMLGQIQKGQLEQRFEHKSGGHVWVLLAVSLVRAAGGEPCYFICQMKNVEERKRAEDELRRALALQSSIVSSAPTAIIATDADGLIVSFNLAAQRMLQYSEADAIGMPAIRLHDPADLRRRAKLLHGAGAAPLEAGFEAIVAPVRSGGIEQREWTYVRQDASSFPVQLLVSALRDEHGAISGFLCIASDISGQRQHEVEMQDALLEKETLLREVYHRVKNNLQVVSSLFNLQLRTITDGAARAALANAAQRVRAMALVHEKLYQSSSLSVIDLDDYLNDLLRRLGASTGANERDISTQCQCPPLRIGIDTAIPLGLIVNELYGNAVKHAFPDRYECSGRPRISVVVTISDAGFNLVVQDNGCGLSAEKTDLLSTSLGLTLVRSLSSQLDASLHIGVSVGTRASLVVPLSRIVL